MAAAPLLPEQVDSARVRAIAEGCARPGLDEIKRRLLAAFPFLP